MKKIKPMTAGAAILAAVLVSNASALTGSESDIINFLNKLNSFLNQTLVPLGMCGAAIAAGLYYFGSSFFIIEVNSLSNCKDEYIYC